MALLSFKDWLNETSPQDRWRIGYARGNYPLRADVMSRSTPPPYILDKAEKELDKPKHKKKKKKDCK